MKIRIRIYWERNFEGGRKWKWIFELGLAWVSKTTEEFALFSLATLSGFLLFGHSWKRRDLYEKNQ